VLEWLSAIDEGVFHAMNGAWPGGDTIMWWVSNPFVWTPLYVGIGLALRRKYGTDKTGRSKRVLILVGLLVCVGLTDLLSSRVLKPTAARLRPSHRVEFVDSISLYEKPDGTVYKGGKYSFVSGHAANHMCIAVLAGILLGGGIWLWFLIGWALLIGYSRIHLGVHFPGDVICGWMVGASIGGMVYNVLKSRI
jgi:undecaprenyl-diphosphatase